VAVSSGLRAGSFALLAALAVLGVLAPRSVADLPANGRAWELITHIPPSSSTGVVGMRPVSDDDERLAYAVIGPPPGSPDGSVLGHGIATRGAAGWANRPLGYPHKGESTDEIRAFVPLLPAAFSEDLRSVLWAALVPLTPDGPPEIPFNTGLYREPPEGPLEFIAAVGNVPPALYTLTHFAEISSDGDWIVFDTSRHLLPADAGRTSGDSIYVWHDGNLQLADVGNSGALLSTCGADISDFHGTSTSASRVFFSASPSCEGPERVYLRDLKDQTTTEVSASRCTRPDCNEPSEVSFAGATPSGSVAYMTTMQQLTDDDEDSARDLYAYDAETDEPTLLSGGSAPATGAVVEGNVVPSEIPGSVYFRATGELLPGEPGTGEKLFLADASGLHLVAEGPITVLEREPQVQVTLDGGRALFVTTAQLLPEDTDSQEDAYLYDSDEEKLTRVSTGPSGGNDAYPVNITAPSPLNQHEFEVGNLRPYYAIDASGEHIVFATEESLVPEDVNVRSDVYEFWHGSVGLVSPGDEPYRSDFGGMSRDGRSVMFATNADLVPEDRDANSRDLYAARFEGGFPQETESAGCDSLSCLLSNQPQETRAAPVSMAPLTKRPMPEPGLQLLRVAANARNGVIVAVVSVPVRGRVIGTIWIRRKHRKIVLAQGSRRAKRPGRSRLGLGLTPAARGPAGGVGKVHLTIRQRESAISRVVRVNLR
jgi:hypothetical protein